MEEKWKWKVLVRVSDKGLMSFSIWKGKGKKERQKDICDF